jgi:hypothetical protein
MGSPWFQKLQIHVAPAATLKTRKPHFDSDAKNNRARKLQADVERNFFWMLRICNSAGRGDK